MKPRRRASIVILLALLAAVWSSGSVAIGQTAFYAGRSYTPESYVKGATYQLPRCNMCNNIRAQWRSQGWVSGYGANKVMATAAPAVAVKPVVVAKPEPIQSEPTDYRIETRSRTVTQYRSVPYQTRQCVIGPFGRKTCQMVTRTRLEPYTTTQTYQVRVPVEKPKEPEYEIEATEQGSADFSDMPDGTPPLVVDAMLAVMGLDSGDTLWDLGSGRDARFLVTAAKRYGCRGIGIEIDPDHAEASRREIRAAGLEDRVTIIVADALKQSYGAASKVVMYQFDDVQAELIAKLQPGTLVGCYSHRPDMDVKRFRVNDLDFYVGVK